MHMHVQAKIQTICKLMVNLVDLFFNFSLYALIYCHYIIVLLIFIVALGYEVDNVIKLLSLSSLL